MESCACEDVRHRSIKAFPVNEFRIDDPLGQCLRVCCRYKENESCIANIAMKSTHDICRLTLRGITYEPRSDVDGVARRERHKISEQRRSIIKP